MKKASFLPLGIAAGLFVLSCENPSKGSATPQAAEEFAQLLQIPLDPNEPMDQEWKNVLEHFEHHMDVHHKSPKTQLTILHLAAIFNKAELVRCLLLDGADPNARTQFFDEADTAIEMALTDISGTTEQPVGADAIIATLDCLLQGGAKPETEKDIVINAISLCDYEEAAMHLLQKLPPDLMRNEEAIQIAAWKGWEQTLNFLINTHTPEKAQLEKALITAAAGAFRANSKHADCIRLLLQRGADINAHDEAARTPIFAAATTLLQAEAEESARILDFIALLLRQGADATLNSQDEEYPGCSAYDLLRMHPSALNELEKRGFSLQAPTLAFTPTSTSLLSDVCKAKQRGQSAEETLLHFDAIASILTPTPEMEESPIYPEALENAISLLCQADNKRTSHVVARMHIWQKPASWLTNEHMTQAVLSALRNHPELVLPAELLQNTAKKLLELKMSDEAATLVEWMGRDPGAESSILALTQDAHPAIRAGAWTAILTLNKLPAPRDGEIRNWIKNHPSIRQDSPALKKALLLTSLEELWYGNMPKARQKQLIAAMHEIGASHAAAQYEKIAQCLHDAEALDNIMSQPNDWKFELEIATAKFILKNEAAFRPAESENTD
ncbi:MAG: hypothetical protein IJ985_05550 [Akkermansia sp.]|nr:hypothetical protein [Akkermansia sp.]